MEASELNDPHGIRRRRQALRWSERELARRAGVPYQRVQSLERASPAGRVPYSRYLANVTRALDEGEGNPIAPPPATPRFVARPAANPRFAARPVAGEMPVYSLRPNQTGGMEMTGVEVGKMSVPRPLAHAKDAYGVQIWGSGNAPKYRPKDIVFVNPQSPPRPVGGVLVMSEDRGDVHIGEFVDETVDEWIIAQFGASPGEKRLSRSNYPIIHAIVAVSTDLVAI